MNGKRSSRSAGPTFATEAVTAVMSSRTSWRQASKRQQRDGEAIVIVPPTARLVAESMIDNPVLPPRDANLHHGGRLPLQHGERDDTIRILHVDLRFTPA